MTSSRDGHCFDGKHFPGMPGSREFSRTRKDRKQVPTHNSAVIIGVHTTNPGNLTILNKEISLLEELDIDFDTRRDWRMPHRPLFRKDAPSSDQQTRPRALLCAARTRRTISTLTGAPTC